MKNNIIKIEPAGFDDITIIGINSSLADFKLAWLINKKLSFNFVREKDIMENGAQYAFFFYKENDDETGNAYNLVSLICKGKYWRVTSPRIDFMLIIRKKNHSFKLDETLLKLREIPGVGYAFVMDPFSDNSLSLLLETIELHEIDILDEKDQQKDIKVIREEVKKREELRLKMLTQSPQ